MKFYKSAKIAAAHCVDHNLIAVGTTRKVFKMGDYVVKQHISPNGYEQSTKECDFYNALPSHLQTWFARPYYVSPEYAIFEYVKPYEKGLDGNYYHTSFKDIISKEKHNNLENFLRELELKTKEYAISFAKLITDLNVGVKRGEIKFVDYGN